MAHSGCRWRLIALAGALLTALMVALGGCVSASAKSSGTLVLYNGQHPQTTQKLVAAFERQTGINVQVRDNDEDVLADQILAEGSRSPADVIYTENSPALQVLQRRGLLARVNRSTLARTPRRYNSARGDWVGISARVSMLIYNPSLISKKQLPSSITQLAKPRYRGKLALAAGETDFRPIVTSYIRAYGKRAALRWLEALKANANAGGHLYSDNETVAAQVNRGVVGFAVINQYYWYRMRAELGASAIHSKLAYFAPRDPGYVLDVSGAAVLRHAKHRPAAQRFLAFLVSRRGQEILAHSISYEYPLGDRVRTTAAETPFAKLKPNPITVSQLGDGSAAIALLREAGLL